jgi:hypothetical protein
MRILLAVTLQMMVVSCASAQADLGAREVRAWPLGTSERSARLFMSGTASKRDYAERLIEESGLVTWNGEPPISDLDGMVLDGFFLYASGGAAISTFYSPDAANVPGLVCMVQETRMQVGEMRREPVRWCADQLGVTLPQGEAPPLIVREGQ